MWKNPCNENLSRGGEKKETKRLPLIGKSATICVQLDEIGEKFYNFLPFSEWSSGISIRPGEIFMRSEKLRIKKF